MPAKNNQIRIIAGQWRGRKLRFPTQNDLRPTGDRVRETLFNWLEGITQGAHCLDAFAGSGVLGWEALSRGAQSCSFIDHSSAVINNLHQQQLQLDCQHAHIYQQRCIDFLQRNQQKQPFNLVFLDPPFANTSAIQTIVNLLHEQQCLASRAWIYFEQTKDSQPPQHSHLKMYRHRQAAQVQYGLLEYNT